MIWTPANILLSALVLVVGAVLFYWFIRSLINNDSTRGNFAGNGTVLLVAILLFVMGVIIGTSPMFSGPATPVWEALGASHRQVSFEEKIQNSEWDPEEYVLLLKESPDAKKARELHEELAKKATEADKASKADPADVDLKTAAAEANKASEKALKAYEPFKKEGPVAHKTGKTPPTGWLITLSKDDPTIVGGGQVLLGKTVPFSKIGLDPSTTEVYCFMARDDSVTGYEGRKASKAKKLIVK